MERAFRDLLSHQVRDGLDAVIRDMIIRCLRKAAASWDLGLPKNGSTLRMPSQRENSIPSGVRCGLELDHCDPFQSETPSAKSFSQKRVPWSLQHMGQLSFPPDGTNLPACCLHVAFVASRVTLEGSSSYTT